MFLIDGSNVGGVEGGRRGARDAPAVVHRIQPWMRGRRERVVVVFDGESDPAVAARYGALEIAWSGSGRSADDEIVRRVSVAPRPGEWTVVTDDRELGRRCRELGARIESVHAFGARTRAASRRPDRGDETLRREKPAANSEEREHWRRVFGVDD